MAKTVKRLLLVLPLLAILFAKTGTPVEASYDKSSNDIFSKSSSSVAYFIKGMARFYGVDENMALFIASHESQLDFRGNVFNPKIVGDDDKTCLSGPNKGKRQRSRGLWQWSDCFHVEITDDCAFDVICSTIKALEWIRDGHENEWSTWRFRNKWFPKIPPKIKIVF